MWFVVYMYCDYLILFFSKLSVQGKYQISREFGRYICPGNQWFQVGNSGMCVHTCTRHLPIRMYLHMYMYISRCPYALADMYMHCI